MIVRPIASMRVANPVCMTAIDPSVWEINEGAAIPLAAANKVIIGVYRAAGLDSLEDGEVELDVENNRQISKGGASAFREGLESYPGRL